MRAAVANTIKKAAERSFLRKKVFREAPAIRWICNKREARRWMLENRDGALNGIEYAVPVVFRDYEQDARIKDMYGGRGSGKTMYCAVTLMRKVIFEGKKLLACREIMDSIQESSKAELEAAIILLGASDLVLITDKRILAKGGGSVTFIGLAKTGEKIKGYAHFDLCWIEEAATVSNLSWKRLIPTIRKAGAEIWLSWNPNSVIDPTWKRFVSESIYPETDPKTGKPYHIRKKINFDDNPFFAFSELAKDEEFMRDADPDEWLHVYGGEPVGALADAIIKPTWFIAALNLHELLEMDYDDGAHLLGGYDVGGTEKGDSSVVTGQLNSVLAYCNEYREIDPVASADRAFRIAEELGFSEVRYDVIGVGLGAKGAIRKKNESKDLSGDAAIPFLPFDVSAPVVRPEQMTQAKRRNKDHYLNLKAQSLDSLAKRFFHAYLFRRYWDESGGVLDYVIEKMGMERIDHLISIDTARIDPKLIEKMKGECCSPTWLKTEGKLQVETKKMLASRGVPSTNILDSMNMAFFKMDKGLFSDAH